MQIVSRHAWEPDGFFDGLEVDHYVDNPLARIDELERRLEELERFALSGLFESRGTTLVLPGGIVVPAFLRLEYAGELTIEGGEISITGPYHSVNTEGGAGSDDLDTVNGGTEGDILVLRAEDSARTVVCKDGTGNLSLAGDFSLDHADDRILLQYDGENWCELSRSNNG